MAGNEHREVAGLRLGWLRPARFCEPQGSTQNRIEVARLFRVDTASFRVPSGTVYSERQRNGRPKARLCALLGLSPVMVKYKNILFVLLLVEDQQHPSFPMLTQVPLS